MLNNSVDSIDGLSYIVLKTAIAQYQKSPTELSPTEIAQVEKQARVQLKIQSVVLKSQEAMDVSIPEPSLNAAVSEISKRYENEGDFFSALENHGMDEETFRDAVKRELHVDAVMDKVAHKAAHISDIDAHIYYHMHPEKFVIPEKRRIRHILVTVNKDYEENQHDKALARISDIREQLMAKPKKFNDLAIRHSECPTAMHGGLLGEIAPGVLFPELEAVAFKMKKNEISQVLESEMGFHILKCETISPRQTLSLNDAMPKIKEHLSEKQRRNCQKHWLAQQLKSYNG